MGKKEIKTELLDTPLNTKALNGLLLARVTYQTVPITLQILGKDQTTHH